METQKLNSRRKFINSLTTGSMVAGLSLIPDPIQAKINSKSFDLKLDTLSKGGSELDQELKKLGSKSSSGGV